MNSQALLTIATRRRSAFFKAWNALSRDEELAPLDWREKLLKVVHSLGPLPTPYRLAKPFRFVSIMDEAYPSSFRELSQPPIGIFLWGEVRHSFATNSISVVGSRKPSLYAIRSTREIVSVWSKLGFSIVSGGAVGIDGEAHRAAVETQGYTCAVLGSGFLKLHPKMNENLFREIVRSRSLLISEYPPEAEARPYFFPERNRLIAALGSCLFLAQAHSKSGSLSTARTALDLGKDVFILRPIPGDPNFSGSQDLLEAGAQSLIDPADLLRFYRRDTSLPKSQSEN